MLGASRYTSGNAKFKAFGQEQFYVEITREGWVYSLLLKEQFDVEKPRESERGSTVLYFSVYVTEKYLYDPSTVHSI